MFDKKTFLLIAAPFISFFFGYSIIHYVVSRTDITVPRLIGQPVHQAIKMASDASLTLKLLREQETADFVEGTVLDQVPKPSGFMRSNQTIYITVAKRPMLPTVPNFLGQTHEQIAKQLLKQGIQAKVFWLEHSAAKGTCFAQSPPPGQELPNHVCTLYCSLGKSGRAVVPNLIGASVTKIVPVLQEGGFSVEVFHTQPLVEGHNCDTCMVTDQKPSAGLVVDMRKIKKIQLQV